MLFLRNIDLSLFAGLKVGRTFTIGELLYVIDDGQALDDVYDWLMYSINTRTFAIKAVPVVCHDFELHWNDISYDDVVVHKGTAYKWMDHQRFMVTGTVESDGFHWRKLQTSGPGPLESMCSSAGIVRADSGTYIMHVMDQFGSDVFDGISYKCELNLDTMQWVRATTRGDETVDNFEVLYLHGVHLHVTSSYVHGFWADFAVRGHMVLNRTTNHAIWAEYDDKFNDPLNGCVFVALDQLFSIVRMQDEDGAWVMIVYRFSESTHKWTKYYQCPAAVTSMSMAESKVVVDDSRVYIFSNYEPTMSSSARELENLFVFELNPSLLDYALAALLKLDERSRAEAAAKLPTDLAAMLTRDTRGDSSCPHALLGDDPAPELKAL